MTTRSRRTCQRTTRCFETSKLSAHAHALLWSFAAPVANIIECARTMEGRADSATSLLCSPVAPRLCKSSEHRSRPSQQQLLSHARSTWWQTRTVATLQQQVRLSRLSNCVMRTLRQLTGCAWWSSASRQTPQELIKESKQAPVAWR